MTGEEMRTLYHQQLRYHAKIPGYVREETEHVVRYVSQTGDKGYILCPTLNSGNALNVIRAELAHFGQPYSC